MKHRGIIKWQPFESLLPNKVIINSILNEKNKISKPILSTDQLEDLNNIILESFYNQSSITIKYFANNYIKIDDGVITSLNYNNKTIIINNKLKLHISQILQINT